MSAEILCAVSAFAASIISGYVCWTKLHPDKLRARFGGDTINFRRWSGLASNVPVFLGYLVGFLVLAALSQIILPGDRFYPVKDALNIAIAPLVAGLLFISVDLLLPPAIPQKSRMLRQQYRGSHPWRWPVLLIAIIGSAVIATVLGIRFPIMSVAHLQVMELGRHAMTASILWIVVATFIVKLLDGLDGAAPMLLLLSGAVVFYTTANTLEFFLSTYCLVIMGAALGSLRFHMHPARLSLRGGGSLFVGFLFATLTVLARQKSITAGLIVIPLLLLALLVGGAMIAFLERNLLLKKDSER